MTRFAIALCALVVFAAVAEGGPIRDRIAQRRAERAGSCPAGVCNSCVCPSGACPQMCPASGFPSAPVAWSGSVPQVMPACANGQCRPAPSFLRP